MKKKKKKRKGKNNFSPLFQFQSSRKIFAFNFHSFIRQKCAQLREHQMRNDTAVVAAAIAVCNPMVSKLIRDARDAIVE